MSTESRKNLYDSVSTKFDIGSFDEFNQKMDNSESRKKLYESVFDDFDLGDFNTFEEKISLKKKVDSQPFSFDAPTGVVVSATGGVASQPGSPTSQAISGIGLPGAQPNPQKLQSNIDNYYQAQGKQSAISMYDNYQSSIKSIDDEISKNYPEDATGPRSQSGLEEFNTYKAKRDELISKRDGFSVQSKAALNYINPLIESDINLEFQNNGLSKFTRFTDAGYEVPDEYKIDDYAKAYAQQNGVSDDGTFKRLVYDKLKSSVSFNIIKPKIQEEFKTLFKKEFGVTPAVAIEKDYLNNFVEGEQIKSNLLLQVQSLNKDIKTKIDDTSKLLTSEYKPQLESLSNDYKNQSASIELKVKQLNESYKSGLIPKESYDLAFNNIQSELTSLNSQYQQNFDAISKEFLNAQNEVYSKYDKRYKRQVSEFINMAEDQINEASSKYGETFTMSDDLKKKYESVWAKATNKFLSEDEAIKYDLDRSFLPNNMGLQFVKNIFIGLGSGIKNISSMYDFDAGYVFGDYIENSITSSSPEIKSALDLLDLTKVQSSVGRMLGGMAPVLGASALTATATKSAPTAIRLLATGLGNYITETAQIGGGVKDEVFRRTGNIADANKAAKKVVDANLYLLPLYAIDGLPLLDDVTLGIKNTFSRAGVKAGLETVTELPQEYFQNIFEELAIADKPISDTFKSMTLEKFENTALNVIPTSVLLGGGGTALKGAKDEIVKIQGKSLAAKVDLFDLTQTAKKQFIYDTVLRRGDVFAKAYVSSLFSSGNINEQELESFSNMIEDSNKIMEETKKAGLNKAQSKVYAALRFDYIQAKNEFDSEQDEVSKKLYKARMDSAEKSLTNYVSGGKPDAVVLTLPNNEQYVYSFETLNSIIDEGGDLLNQIINGDVTVGLLTDKNNPKAKALSDKLNTIKKDAVQKPSTSSQVSPVIERGQVIQEGSEGVGQGIEGTEAPQATNEEEVALLREQEQQELLEAIPNIEEYKVDGEIDEGLMDDLTLEKYNEIYDKYDRLITPLLAEAPAQAAPEIVAGVSATNKSQLNDLKSRVTDAVKSGVVQTAERAINTLKSILPGFDIVIHENEDSYNEATGNINTRGNFSYSVNPDGTYTGTIDINLSKANERTVAHEVAHAVLLKVFGENTKLFKAFRFNISKILTSSRNRELVKFANLYGTDVKAEEYLVELTSILEQQQDTISPTVLQQIAAYINDIVSNLTNGALKPFESVKNTKDIIDFFNTVSGAIREGAEISEDGTKFKKFGEQVVKGPESKSKFQANYTDDKTGITFSYDENGDTFKNLVNNGYITYDKKIEDFAGQYAVYHKPDYAFSGDILKDGFVIVEGQGGIYYPIKFHKDGLFWAASSERAAKALVKRLNEAAKNSPDGKARLILVSSPNDKVLSSFNAAAGIVDVLSSKVFDNKFGLSENDVKLALLESAKAELGADVNDRQSLKDIVNTVKEKLTPENIGSIDKRRNFTFFGKNNLLSKISEQVKDTKNVQDLIEFFGKGIKNDAFVGTRTGKLSKANLTQAFAYMFNEPMLRDFKESDLAYAVLEVPASKDGGDVVTYEKNDSHKSYPYSVVIKDKSAKTTLHILSEKTKWNESAIDPLTEKTIQKDRMLNILDTLSGLSNKALMINGPVSKSQKVDEEIKFTKKDGTRISVKLNDITLDAPVVDNFEKNKLYSFGIMSGDNKLGDIMVTAKGDDIQIGVSAVYKNLSPDYEKPFFDKVLDLLKKIFVKPFKNVVITDSPNRGKGIGKTAYGILAKTLQEKYNKKLLSDTVRSSAAEGLWRSLERKGLAKVIGDKTGPKEGYYYEYIVPKSSTTPVSKSQKIDWEVSKEGKGDPTISVLNPIVKEASKNLKEGKITNEEYRATVSENSPIGPITRFFAPATEEQIYNALDENKKDKTNVPIKSGTKVALRLDIPAYKNKNTWVVSVHDGTSKSGGPISYTNVARIKDVNDFNSSPLAALNISAGVVNKTPIGKIFGTWIDIPGDTLEQKGENAKKLIEDIVDNPAWVQIGMNPFRHSYFYDRSNDIGRPVMKADEVIQVGGLVYAKNPVYGNWTDEAFEVKGLLDSSGKVVKFQKVEGEEQAPQKGGPLARIKQAIEKSRKAKSGVGPVSETVEFEEAEVVPSEKGKANLFKSLNAPARSLNKLKQASEGAGNFFNKLKRAAIDTKYDIAKALTKSKTPIGDIARAAMRNAKGYTGASSLVIKLVNSQIFDRLSFAPNVKMKLIDDKGNTVNTVWSERQLFDAFLDANRIINIDARIRDKFSELVSLSRELKNGIKNQSLTKEEQDELVNQISQLKDYLLRRKALEVKGPNGQVQMIGYQDPNFEYTDKLIDLLKEDYAPIQYTHTDGKTQADAEGILAEMKAQLPDLYKTFDKMSSDYYDTFRYLLDESLKNGLITKEVYDELWSYNYIPTKFIQHFIEGELAIDNPSKSKKLSASLKNLTGGSEEDVITNYQYILELYAHATYRRIFDNRAAVKLAQAIGKIDPNKFGKDSQFFIQKPNGKDKKGNPTYSDPEKGYDYIKFMVDGVENRIVAPKQFVDIWYDSEFQSSPWLDSTVNFLSKLTLVEFIKGVFTKYSPVFGVTQILLDAPQALISTKAYPDFFLGSVLLAKDYATVAKDVMSIVRDGKPTKFFVEAVQAGVFSDFLSTENDLIRGEKFTNYDGTDNIKNKIKYLASRVNRGVDKTLESIAKVNEAVEYSTRLAVYYRMKQNLISKFKKDNNGAEPTGQDLENIQLLSAEQARNVVDFSVGGGVTKQANRLFAYLNSTIQVFVSAARSLKNNPWKAGLMMLEIGAAGAALLAYSLGDLGGDDDEEKKKRYKEYRKRSTYEKESYFLMWTGDPERPFLRIPKPPLFKGLINLFEQAYLNASRGEEFDQEKMWSAFQRDIPFGNPLAELTRNPAINAAVKYFNNYDQFRKENIVKDEEKILDYAETKGATQLYKKIGKASKDLGFKEGVSPKRLQEAVRSFTGDPSKNTWASLFDMGSKGAVALATGDAKELEENFSGNLYADIFKNSGLEGKLFTKKIDYDASFAEQLEEDEKEEFTKNYVIRADVNELRKNSKDIRSALKSIHEYLKPKVESKDIDSEYANRVIKQQVKLFGLKDAPEFYDDVAYAKDNDTKAKILNYYLSDMSNPEAGKVMKDMVSKGLLSEEAFLKTINLRASKKK